MYILAIETTGPKCSAAIINEDRKVTGITSGGELNHLQNLTPIIANLLEKCQLSLGDVSAIAASCGPGSFTGIRIGVTTARALAQAKGIKTIAVPTLKSFAYHKENYHGAICPLFDARRNQVYSGAYIWRDGEILEITEGAPYDIEEYMEKLTGALIRYSIKDVTILGDGIAVYGTRMIEWASKNNISITIDKRVQEAESVAKLAADIYSDGNLIEFGELRPNYMRKPEAERRLEEKK